MPVSCVQPKGRRRSSAKEGETERSSAKAGERSFTLFTPLGAGLAAYAKRNWVKAIGGAPCHPLSAALAAALLLAGCAGWTLGGRIDAREARILDQARQAALSQVIAWNAAGVDPVRLPVESLTVARLGCGTAAALGAVSRPGDPELAEQLTTWCATLLRAAGPASAAPRSVPVPNRKPGP